MYQFPINCTHLIVFNGIDFYFNELWLIRVRIIKFCNRCVIKNIHAVTIHYN